MEFFLYFNMKKKIITISFIAVLSIIFWGAVALSQDYIATIKVRIVYTDLPKNYSVGYSSITESYLQVKGKGWELAKLSVGSVEDFYVSVHRRPGRHKKDLSDFIESNQWLFPSMQVLQISPSQIEFDVDRINSKIVKLAKNFTLNFKQGFDATSEISLDPAYVEVFGSYSLLRKVDSIRTVAQEFNNVSEAITTHITLEETPGLRYSVNRTKLDVDVQKIVDKSFVGVPVEVKNVPDAKELILYPAKIDVVLRGGINKLGKLTNDSLKVVIDFWDALKEEGGKVEPEIIIPKFTNIISVEPKKLEYIIKQY